MRYIGGEKMDLKVNDIFEGKYKIIKLLGEGGMGKVFLAENTNLGNYWAIKQVKKNPKNNIDLLAEPNIMKNLNHPSLPRIFDVIENENYIYIILDYVEGASLDEELNNVGKFPENQVVEWAKEICYVLIYLHTLHPYPIIYRDMKPSNLMITGDGKIKVIDFGIAREYKKEAESDTTYMGTYGYAAPEQVHGTSQTDERTDIYSLGVTLYHLVTGKSPNEPPFEIIKIRELDASLSEGLEHIIAKCTKQDPEQRYQDAKELLSDLNNLEKFSQAYKKARNKHRVKIASSVASVILFSALTFTGVSEFKAEQITAYQEMVDLGKKALVEKQFEQAKKKLTEAIDFKPQELSAYQQYGRTLLSEGNYEEVVNYITNDVFPTIEGSTDDSDLYYLMASALFELKDYQKAIDHFQSAIKLSPNNVTFHRDLAVSLARTGNFEEANKTLAFIEEKGNDAEVTSYVKGEILAAQEKYDEAIDSFNKTIENGKNEVLKEKAYISLARLYKENAETLDDQNANKRIEVLENAKASLKDKNNLMITEMLAEAYYDKGKFESNNTDAYNQSITYFQSLLDSGYQRPYIYRNIGIIYQVMGNYGKSEEILLEMKEVYPTDYTCYNQLALLYAEMEGQKPLEERNYQKTVENYELALKYSPDGEKTNDLRPLVNFMNELKSNGWVN